MGIASRVTCAVCHTLTDNVIIVTNPEKRTGANRYFFCGLCAQAFAEWEKAMEDAGIPINPKEKDYYIPNYQDIQYHTAKEPPLRKPFWHRWRKK